MPVSPRELAQSLESTTDPAFAVDGDGKIIVWNSVARATLGHSRKRVLGEPCYKVISGKDVFGNLVCRRNCFVFQRFSEGRPVRRFRMYVCVSTGHHVVAECAPLRVRFSSDESVVIHLLRLGPGRGEDSPPHRNGGPAQASSGSVPLLTPREREVLGLLAAGRSTCGMVEDLGVSRATVRTHVENILRKLGAHSRLEAVAVAFRNDLLG